jgi:hypothetical protein
VMCKYQLLQPLMSARMVQKPQSNLQLHDTARPATALPSGEKQSLPTVALCPFSSCAHFPLLKSHMKMAALVPISPAARCVPPHDHATHCKGWLLVVDLNCWTCLLALESCTTTKLLATYASRWSAVGQAAATDLPGSDKASTAWISS